MAALNRPTQATYEVHETVKVDTSDNEDHTFCGIIFPVKAKTILPVEKIVIHSIAVRGQLGPMTVWVSQREGEQEEQGGDSVGTQHGAATASGHLARNNAAPEAAAPRRPRNGNYNFPLHRRQWKLIYQQTHAPSQRVYTKLDLRQQPIVLEPGEARAIYVHSTLDGDEAIVYDNSVPGLLRRRGQTQTRYEDSMIAVYSGRAHLSPVPFGQRPIWGWGNAWRDHREFVGQIEYGCVYKLWNPDLHNRFGGQYRKAVETLLACQRARADNVWSILPDECVYYILNMCRWDWFDDSAVTMKANYRRRKQLLAARAAEQRRSGAGQAAAASGVSVSEHGSAAVAVAGNQAGANGANVMIEGVAEALAGMDEDSESVDGDDEAEADDDDDDEEEDDDASNESEWERQNGYRADDTNFQFVDVSSDEEDNANGAADEDARQRQWFRLNFNRIQILRALAPHGHGRDDDMNIDT